MIYFHMKYIINVPLDTTTLCSVMNWGTVLDRGMELLTEVELMYKNNKIWYIYIYFGQQQVDV